MGVNSIVNYFLKGEGSEFPFKKSLGIKVTPNLSSAFKKKKRKERKSCAAFEKPNNTIRVIENVFSKRTEWSSIESEFGGAVSCRKVTREFRPNRDRVLFLRSRLV